MATARAFDRMNPAKLKKHPKNLEIYGDVVDKAFVEKCRKGIRLPVAVLPDGTVLSGHRRVQAAKIIGLKEIDVIVVYDLVDELEIIEFIIDSNASRVKTAEEVAREDRELVRIESERAAARQRASLKKGEKTNNSAGIPVSDSKSLTGKATEIVADKRHVSAKTVEREVAAVDAIDEAKKSGDTERAEDIRTTLNERGAAPAAEKAKPPKKKPADKKDTGAPKKVKPGAPLDFNDEPIKELYGKLIRKIDDRAEHQGGQGRHHKQCLMHLKAFHSAFTVWQGEGRGAR